MKPIVVVDDEPMLRSIVTRMLADHGFRALEATDGLAALELLNGLGRDVGLVLTDIVMPELDGIALLERLARTHPGVPVLLMSGYSEHELELRRLVSPCGILRKPFSSTALIAEVRRCLTTAAA